MIQRTKIVKSKLCAQCPYYECKLVNPTIIHGAELLLVGEAPGESEAQNGIPFIGVSGQKLRTTMRNAGFNMTRIAVTNTVLCHPPQNEVPRDKAIRLCVGQFFSTIFEAVEPKMILLVGAEAKRGFSYFTGIDRKATDTIVWRGTPVEYVMHPAAVLYNPDAESTFRKGIRQVYNKLYPNNNPYKLVVVDTMEQLEEVRAFVAQHDTISSDIETNNTLDPFSPNARITRISFGDESIGYSLSFDRDDTPVFNDAAGALVKDMYASGKLFVFQRSWFDTKFLKARASLDVPRIRDTRVMAYLLDENRKNIGLKDLALEYDREYQYTIGAKTREDFGRYNAEDSVKTARVYTGQLKEMTPALLRVMDELIMPMIPVINEMMITGIKVDQAYARTLTGKVRKKRDEAVALLIKEFPIFRGVSLTSPDQLRRIVFDVMKEKVQKENEETKIASLDGEVLGTFAYQGKAWARHLLNIRSYEKLLSTYIEKMPKLVYQDGRIRTQLDPIGTVTGRLSSADPNLQNIPRDNEIYRMFVADDGKVFMYFDMSQLELRIAACVANERKMIEAFVKKMDLHRLTGSMITGKKPEDITKDERTLSKGVGFGLIYGQQAPGLKDYLLDKFGIDLPLSEVEKIRDMYFERYDGLTAWYRRVEMELWKTGQVVSPTGRIRRFPVVRAKDKVPGDVFRQGVNFPVQGGGSDVVVWVMNKLWRLVQKRKLPVKFVLMIHDSVIMEMPNDRALAEEVKDMVNLILSDALPSADLFKWVKVPIEAEFKVGPTWSDLEVF